MHWLHTALAGKKVTGIAVSGGESELKLSTTDGDVVIGTEADCCSQTWFAELIAVDALLGHTVSSVEELDLPSKDDGHTRQESDSFYGFGITTEAGRSTVVFRNSSNGYYGGGAILVDEPSAATNWTSITDDWTAYG